MRCDFCSCTDSGACVLDDGPCAWIVPGLCSNPDCMNRLFEAMGGIDGVRAMAKQAIQEIDGDVQKLQPSPERDEMITIGQRSSAVFSGASEAFLRDWLFKVALPSGAGRG